MLSSIKIPFYIFLFVVTLCLGNGLYSKAPNADCKSQRMTTTKILLAEKLLSLNFERLANRDFAWLESIGANYDYDNNQYFIELESEATLKDSIILLMLDFSAKESVEIRIFAPEKLDYIWIHSKLRATTEQLYISYVFHPQNNKSRVHLKRIQRNPELATAHTSCGT